MFSNITPAIAVARLRRYAKQHRIVVIDHPIRRRGVAGLRELGFNHRTVLGFACLRRIFLDTDLNDNDRAQVFAHELCHVALHTSAAAAKLAGGHVPNDCRESEADACALSFGMHFGFDTTVSTRFLLNENPLAVRSDLVRSVAAQLIAAVEASC